MRIRKKTLKKDYKFILWVNKTNFKLCVIFGIGCLVLALLLLLVNITIPTEIKSPLPQDVKAPIEKTATPSASPKSKTKTEKTKFWTGIASWYSVDGCIGCSKDRIMANGEKLDDNKKTVAFNKLPLGSTVKIWNMENDMVTTAEVTDTGGFEALGRIIDITPAVKNAIGCGDLCKVRVYEL